MKLSNPFAQAKTGTGTVTASNPSAVPDPSKPDQLGWRIATFAKDTFLPTPGTMTTSTAIWHAYLQWCREGGTVPLAMNVFLSRLDALTVDAGIERFQNGPHILYRDLTLGRA